MRKQNHRKGEPKEDLHGELSDTDVLVICRRRLVGWHPDGAWLKALASPSSFLQT